MRQFAIRNSPFAFLATASRWLFLAALVYAPWDYGGVTEPAIVRLNWILGAAVVAFAAPAAVKGYLLFVRGEGETGSHSRWALYVPVALLLLFGWGMVLNAKAIYDSDFYLFVPVTSWWPQGPGSIDQAVSAASMVRVTVLLGAIVMVADLSRDPRWLLRLWFTLGLTGGSIALLGLIQKASGAPMIFWAETSQPIKTFFATFYYHGNAGAFLNLTLPVTIGLAWRAFTRPGQRVNRALWLALSVIAVVAAFSNTSRTSQALAAGMLLVLAAASLPKALGLARRRLHWATAVAGAVAILFALFAVVQTSRLDRAWQRWERVSETLPGDARWNAAKAAWRALPEAGWTGFGPGTFAIVFPYYTAGGGENLRGRWIFLHQDYLQTLLEWGRLGGGLLGWVFLGGMAAAGWNLLRERKRRREMPETMGWLPRQRLFLALVLLGLGSVALHALVDFPLQVASIQLYTATCLGICWGSGRWRE